ncbi:ATP-dependent helicase HrpB [Acidiferrimicrobium sp. IK]|uniref:ATP-dependent helicase HrpB n=1 Tax=Acidiferrimicrobium sp. IK TaxID=2871700 RepID=UPI0021CB02EB|nr:ATP-dependent helicase HrpB [Acidiferrimicrobium sp. IK]MCU4187382.1 ATP-dependent helicase HrpB [Acidiferrimicrobium sp. IK]
MPPSGRAGDLDPPHAFDTALPVDAALGALHAALASDGVAVLQAPPGSGKTTRVPLTLLDLPWLGDRRVLVLEPRRVAARAAARRMASTLGEQLGERVGYRVRQDRVTGPATRVEVITEGVLLRMLQADPSLEGVGAVLFDEWHERSITADFGLALTLDARAALRPDLRLVVMSATLHTGAVSALLGGAPVVTAHVTPYPIQTVWLGRPAGRVEGAVATAIGRALREQAGDVLAFLPGAAEIRTVGRFLAEDGGGLAARGVDVVNLHGSLSGADQDAALQPPAPGRRKVVLASAVAETSLTIDGVRVVVDSGLMRAPRFDPASGMTRLVTLPASRATAEQRRGRAGRQAPGACYRLWSEAEHPGLPAAPPPEILVADLAPVALGLAEWGADDPATLSWVDPPPAGPLAAARTLLAELGALHDGRITAHGRDMARLGVHPRLAHLLLRAGVETRLACEVAAVLSDGDPLRGDGRGGPGARDVDLAARVEALRRGRAPQHAATARRLADLVGVGPETRSAPDGGDGRLERRGPAEHGDAGRRGRGVVVVASEDVGRLVALAYPDRVGRLRDGRPGHWLLRNGRGAWTADTDPMAAATWVVAADLDGDRRDARIWLGAPLHPDDVEELFGPDFLTVDRAGWDRQSGDVVAVRERRLGAITVSSTPLRDLPPGLAVAGLIEGVRAGGIGMLPWTRDLDAVRDRVAFARRVDPGAWTDVSDAALLEDLDSWLTPWLEALAASGRPLRRGDLSRLALGDALWSRIGWSRRAELDAVAPTHLQVPSGQRHRIAYPADGPPTVEVRLQELFGSAVTPTVAGGRVPVLLRLTSPAGRPVQVTSDLASFWANGYPQVRGELRARYPRHPWPEDPRAATPTSRAAPRRRR